MLTVRDTYDMSIFEQAIVEGRPVDVIVFVLAENEDRVITIRNMRHETNGWGEQCIVGIVLEQGNIVRVTLCDNAMDAHPLSLK
jgi:hypothetical protein